VLHLKAIMAAYTRLDIVSFLTDEFNTKKMKRKASGGL
jgi:hypothetical protein